MGCPVFVFPLSYPLVPSSPHLSFVGVGEATWQFKTTFQISEDELKKTNADLLFEGLDTFATIALVCGLVPNLRVVVLTGFPPSVEWKRATPVWQYLALRPDAK